MRLQLPGGHRTWGKYAAELLIVAAGVVLGLWASEWAADRRAETEVSDAYRALNSELLENFGTVKFRHAVEPCVRRRISDLQGWISRQAAGERTPLPNEIGRPGSIAVFSSVWDVSKAGQVAAKMPLAARLRYAAIYDSLDTFSDLQERERDVWFAIGDFAGLSEVPAPDRARLNGLLSRAAALDEALSLNYSNITKDFARLGVSPPVQLPGGMTARRAICQPFDKLRQG
jgi:hypothetical protein